MKQFVIPSIIALATLIVTIKCEYSQSYEEYDDDSSWSSEQPDYVGNSGGYYGERPKTFSPNHYDVTLKFITDNDSDSIGSHYKVKGSIRILGTVLKNSDKLTLDAEPNVDIADNSVKILLVNATDSDDDEFYGINTLRVETMCRGRYSVEIKTNSIIEAGTPLEIYIEFTSQIYSACSYRGHSPICITQDNESMAIFSSTTPSFMFPSFTFDTAENVATVQLTLVHSYDLHNTIVNNRFQQSDSYDREGWTVQSFFTPNAISIYETFFVISNYSFMEQALNSKLNRSVRIHAPQNAIAADDTMFTKLTDMIVKLVTTYENYLGVSDDPGFPRLDIILPPDNSGEVNSRGMLVYPNGIPTGTVDRVYKTLVTSLAIRWVEMPGSGYYGSQIDYDFQNGLVEHLESIGRESNDENDNFYTITRNKEYSMYSGTNRRYMDWASILRMLEMLITPPTFQKGFSCFVHTSERNISNFYTCMQTAADENGSLNAHNITVEHFMESWRNHDGLPLLKVVTVNETFISISQEKFSLPDYYYEETSNPNDPWLIPISIQTENGSSPNILLLRQPSILVEHNASKWLIINPEARGYHRTLYDNQLTEMLRGQFETDFEAIETLSRYQILSDYFQFALKDYVNYTTTLKLMKYAINETQPVVHNLFVDFLEHLHGKFLSSPNYTVIKEYINGQLKRLWNMTNTRDLTTDEEIWTLLESFKQSKVLQTACQLSAPWCFPLAQDYISKLNGTQNFQELLYEEPLTESMLCSLVAHGEKPAMEFALAKFNELSQTNYWARKSIAKALTCTTDLQTSLELLDLAWNVSTNFYSGMETFLWPMTASPGYSVVLPYITDNFQRFIDTPVDLHGYRDSSNNTISNAVLLLSRHYNTIKQQEEMTNFVSQFKTFLVPILDELEMALEQVEENLLWMNRQGTEILEFLRSELSN